MTEPPDADASLRTTEDVVHHEERARRFLDDAAHQLRAPLAGIQACAEALLRGPTPAERDRLLASLVRQAALGGKVVGALLRLARLQQGEPLNRSRCDVVLLCADEADRTWSLTPHLDIVLKAGERTGDHPLLDADAVREIMAHLLDNARRHAAGQIQVLIDLKPSEVQIRVVDDGPGLPEAMLEHAFEPFSSVHPTGESGLGLPIARALARAHGGELTYEEGGFLLRLPVDQVRDRPSE